MAMNLNATLDVQYTYIIKKITDLKLFSHIFSS